MNYYVCSGLDPTEDFKNPIKIYGVAEIGSVLLNIAVFIRIRIFKESKKNRIGIEPRGDLVKRIFLTDIKTQSLSSLSVNLCNLVNLALTKISLSFLNHIEPSKINEYGNIILIHYMILPCFILSLYLFFYYVNHQLLRKALINALLRR